MFQMWRVHLSVFNEVALRSLWIWFWFGLSWALWISSSVAFSIIYNNIINPSLSQRKFPDPWKPAVLCAIFKNGDSLHISNYKPTSILNHTILLNRLLLFNLSRELLNLIMSYVPCHFQLVKVNNHKSNLLQLSTGVPQGSILGPIFFSLYINDLSSARGNCNVLLYADDTVIYPWITQLSIPGKTAEDIMNKITDTMSNPDTRVESWLNHICLQLSVHAIVHQCTIDNYKSICLWLKHLRLHYLDD